MSVILSETERSRLRRMVKRPRSRKQLYRAQALLALDEGHAVDTVARMFKMNPERLEAWVEGFGRLRLKFLDEPKGPGPKARWEGPPDEGEGAVELE